MNPIVYNKNGQYRFTDFVGYLPEFLQSEPDVVTYMQVLSDYINNAYRNVDVTDEFELIKVCSSTDVKSVLNWMERLSDMFRLACDRGEPILYLSVPRNNINSNVILGNATAEYAREIEIDYDTIVDRIDGASRRIGTKALNDGDIVYVNYRNRALHEKVAYYYLVDVDTLVKDSMCTSQDPFTGTYNEPSTAMQFKVTEVGKVLRRYGGVHDDGHNRVIFYEVVLPIHISDIERVPATGTVTYDVDSNGIDDMLFVDYYNLSNATSGDDTKTFNTYMKFAGDTGFKWHGDYPSGMFYFKNTSAAKLSRVDYDGTMMLADPIEAPSVERYRILSVKKTSGVYRVYMDAFPGLYGNALFYISRVNGANTEDMGVYRMVSEISSSTRFDSGELYIDLVNVSGIDYGIEELDNLVLISIPLAASKYELDFDTARPLIKWSREITGPSGIALGTAANIKMTSAVIEENQTIYTGSASNYTTSFEAKIALRKDLHDVIAASDMVRGFYTDNGGTVHDLFTDEYDRPAIVTVRSVQYSPDTGNCIIQFNTPSTSMSPAAFAGDIVLQKITSGYILSPYEESEMAYNITLSTPLNDGDMILVSATDEYGITRDVFTRIAKGVDTQAVIVLDEPLHISYMTEIKRVIPTDTGIVHAFDYVKIGANNTVIGAVNRLSYERDVFTPKYMIATSKELPTTSLMEMITDVVPYDPSSEYEYGQYVYDAPYVKKVIRHVDVREDGIAVNSNSFAVDRVVHYSLGFKEMKNTFTPYCGAVSTLDYDEKVNYAGDMSISRMPMYIKKVNDVRLKYGWNQRQYVYYHDDIGVAPMSRAGFIEVYSGNQSSPVDVDLTQNAYQMAASLRPENDPVMLYGCGSSMYNPVIDSRPTATINTDGSWTVTVVSSGHGLPDGARVSVTVTGDEPEGFVFEADDVKITAVSADIIQYVTHPSEMSGLVARISDMDDFVMSYDRSYGNTSQTRPHTYPEENDLVLVDDTLYVVQNGPWIPIEPTAIRTPTTIYCRHNLFDESVTNPTFALGDEYTIKNIIPIDNGVVQLQISGRIPDFEQTADGIDRRVYLQYINQGGLNGWHSVKTVHNGGVIDIYVDPSIKIDYPVQPITNRYMTVRAGRWYKYTLNGYEWDKKSNKASYVTSNIIVEMVSDNHDAVSSDTFKTKYKHNLSVGDSVLLDRGGNDAFIYGIDDTTTREELERNVIKTVVVSVIDDYTIVFADTLSVSAVGSSVIRGYIVSDRNVSRINGEYVTKIDGKTVRLRQGDIIILMEQVCRDEIKAWRVTSNTVWIPMKEKRTFKIDDIAVDMKRNPAYDIGDDFDTEAEYRYVTYMDSNVSNDVGSLQIGYMNARNYHFEHPHIENLDTTQNTIMQYSSKYDYASVAPRDGMDVKFKGVPDMGYPLAERIERLAYLRDPEVLDIDLIEYLARFMGYDITPLADDIRSSNIYKNSTERENAIRETLAHLPQFYALNGTKPGINMLMATFGLIGELVTMWTSTDDPYGKLVRQDEVGKYIDADRASGKTTNSWVPTPHVMLDIIENDNYNSILLGNEELVRMKEQIRRCKPINVVFDGIRVVFNTMIKAEPKIAVGGSRIQDSSFNIVSLDADVDDVDVQLDPCLDEDCDF